MNVLNKINVVGSDGSKDTVLKIQNYTDYHNPLTGVTREVASGFTHLLESSMDELGVNSDTEFWNPKTDITYKA